MAHNNIHIVPADKGWAVKREGSLRASSKHPNQQEAIQEGRRMALNEKLELIIHRKDGKIRDKESYGSDPFPPRDRKY